MIYWITAAWCALLSITGFVMCALDKSYAKQGRRRIRERTLFLTAALGGSPGVWAGMYTFRHKTKHMSFVFGIPAILLGQIALIILLVYFKVL